MIFCHINHSRPRPQAGNNPNIPPSLVLWTYPLMSIVHEA